MKKTPKRTFGRTIAVMLLSAMLITSFNSLPVAAKNQTGGKHNDTLRVSSPTVFASIDPHYLAQNMDFYLASLLYESFYNVDDLGNFNPRLATGLEISEDGLVYTYSLKSGVKWQTGGDFTANDVVYSINRAKESPYMQQYVGYIDTVEALDDLTVVITLLGISPTFEVDINRVSFLSEEATKELEPGFTNEIPGGTAPYTLKTWKPDSKVVVTRNPDYYDEPAPIGTIDITVFGDTNAATRAFEAGELDYNPILASDWDRIVKTGKYRTYIEDTISAVFVSMNNQVAPFDDPLVRQAFNYAVDKDDMIFAAAENFGEPASVIGNHNLVFGLPKPGEIFEYEYNPEKAKELLAEAGYPNGLTLSEPILTLATDEFSIPAQVLQAQLADIGVTAEIRTVEQSALVMDLVLGNYTTAVMGLSLSVDAAIYSLAYTTSGIDALNLARYSNERVDELFGLAGSSLDKEARLEYYREAFDIASREAAYLPLYSMKAGFATDPDLNSSVYTNWYYWYWNK